MASYVINFDGTQKKVEPKNGTDFQLDELQEFVGGYIEVVQLTKKRVMVVNEEGKCCDLPYNHLATLCANEAGLNDVIVGNVLVCNNDLIK